MSRQPNSAKKKMPKDVIFRKKPRLKKLSEALGRPGMSRLYYGDNLPILRNYIASESIDLIYLDPPFNSNQDYNILFKEQSGEPAKAQIKAFTDTWEWSEKAYTEFCESCPNQVLVDLVQGFVKTLGRNDVTAYLVMMAPRLVELHRVLKKTGSLYLHCDPTASHYLKLMLDCVFGPKQFRNEVVWKRTTAHSDGRRAGRIHDNLLFYTKSEQFVWNEEYQPYDPEYVEKYYRYTDPDGRRWASGDVAAAGPGPARYFRGELREPPPGSHWRFSQENIDRLLKEGRIYFTKNGFPRFKRYLDEMPGMVLQDIWADKDVQPVVSWSAEGLGYPTQKPIALLERVINASSNPGDIVLDPFCGCGTAVVAAQKLKRKWVGIDITHLAIALIKYRLSDQFRPRLREGKDYDVIGEPTTVAEAHTLAHQDRDEFQKWAVGLVPRAFPFQDKKGADTGIDGVLRFTDDPREEPKKSVIQVKSGHLTLSVIRDFAHVIDREKATVGLFVTLEPPSKPMKLEADKLGFYTTPLGNRKILRFQIRTVEQLLAGVSFDIPQTAEISGVRTAAQIKEDKQIGLL